MNFLGRVDLRDPKGPRFAWSGSGFSARFSGSSVRVVFQELPKPGAEHWPNRYRVELDGVVTDGLSGPKEFVFQKTGLSATEHSLVVLRQNEPLVGASQLISAEANWLPDGPRLARRLDVIGDSVSTAFGVEGADENAGFDSATQNHWNSYCAIAARELGAELHTMAWSGRGLCQNRSGNPTELTMPKLWERALPEDEGSIVVASRLPDAVVVLLGGNDFVTDDPAEKFTSAYVELIKVIRTRSPNAHVICAMDAQFEDEFSGLRTLVRGYLEQVKATVNDARVHVLEFSPRLASDGLGSLGHHRLITHQRMAGELAATLRRVLGW